MDFVRDVAGWIAAAFSLYGAIVYVRSLWLRTSTTRWSSWLIWSVTSAASLATYYGSGARNTAWVPAVSMLFCWAAFVVAFVRRDRSQRAGGLDSIEIICLLGALAAVPVWALSGSAVNGQILSVGVEVLGYVPVWRAARGESLVSWKFGAIGGAINLAAVPALSFELLLYPVAILTCQLLVIWLAVWPARSASSEVLDPEDGLAAA